MSVLYVGVDVSSQEMEVSGWVQEAVRPLGSVSNNEAGFAELGVRLAPLVAGEGQVHLVVEPTGGYELRLVAWAHEQGWQVSLPNPWQVRRWAEGEGVRAKTDGLDSQILTRYGVQKQPAPSQPLPAHIEALDQLLRRQEDLEKMLRQERNRAQHFACHPQLPKAVSHNIESVIAALEAALAELEAHVQAHPDLVEHRRLLLTVAGVGEKTVLALLVFLARWQALTAGQGDANGLTAYAGLDPVPYTSGKRVYQRPTFSKQGSRTLRSRLVAAARGGTRTGHSPLRQFYLRRLGRHKPKRLAQVAAARKILIWAWAVFRDQLPFQPHRALPASLVP